jgi:hypothetical protein
MTINSQVGERNKIEHTGLENSAENIVNSQYGNKNKISSQLLASGSVQKVVCHQEGDDCKIALKLFDETNTKWALDVEGRGNIVK